MSIQNKIVLFLIGFLCIFGAYTYISDLRDELKTANGNVTILQNSVNAQNDVIEGLTTDIKSQQRLNKKLNDTTTAQQREIDQLNEKFNVKANGQSRDLGGIARAKPGLVTPLVNKGTMNVNRCFEIATGSKLNEGEKNDECKELVNSLAN